MAAPLPRFSGWRTRRTRGSLAIRSSTTETVRSLEPSSQTRTSLSKPEDSVSIVLTRRRTSPIVRSSWYAGIRMERRRFRTRGYHTVYSRRVPRDEAPLPARRPCGPARVSLPLPLPLLRGDGQRERAAAHLPDHRDGGGRHLRHRSRGRRLPAAVPARPGRRLTVGWTRLFQQGAGILDAGDPRLPGAEGR